MLTRGTVKRTLLPVVLAVVVALATAGTAEAKFSSARLCGRDGCHRLVGHDATSWRQLGAIEAAVFGGVIDDGHGHSRPASPGTRPAGRPPEAEGWYRVTFCGGPCVRHNSATVRVLPRSGYQYLGSRAKRIGSSAKRWMALGPRPTAVYRTLASGLRPLPAGRLVAFGARSPTPDAHPEGGSTSDVPWLAIGLGIAGLAAIAGIWRFPYGFRP